MSLRSSQPVLPPENGRRLHRPVSKPAEVRGCTECAALRGWLCATALGEYSKPDHAISGLGVWVSTESHLHAPKIDAPFFM